MEVRSTLPSETDVRDLMWDQVGLFRDRSGLTEAVATLDGWASALEHATRARCDPRIASLITTGRLVARAALRREESRGAHYRADFPQRNDIDWSRHRTESKP
jgi:L-aspartate oxidase